MGPLSPCSHLANVLGSTPTLFAASFCDIPSVVRCRINCSAMVFASGSGLWPRKRMTAGMHLFAGLLVFASHLKTLVVFTPICSATSRWSIFKPSRFRRM